MNIQEFYKKYHLNKYEFSEMAHVGTRSLVKYANGEKLRDRTVEKINKAMCIVEDNNLVRPHIENYRRFDARENGRLLIDVQKYKSNFEKLLKSEG